MNMEYFLLRLKSTQRNMPVTFAGTTL